MIFHRDLVANLNVCPKCGHHMRIGPAERFAYTFDTGSLHGTGAAQRCRPIRCASGARRNIPTRSRRPAPRPARPEALHRRARHAGRPAGDGRRCSPSISWAARWAWAWARRWSQAMRSRHRRKAALHPVRLLRRRAHAGRHAVADADAARHHRGRHAARSGPALYRGADRSHLWRRQRLLCHAGRHPDRRAGRADRLHRRARHRPDHPRETAGRLPARRISAGAWHAGHGGASHGDARHPVAGAAYADETSRSPRSKVLPCRRASATATATATPSRDNELSQPLASDAVLARLLALHPKKIDLALDRILRLLARSGQSAAQAAAGDPCRRHQRQGLGLRLFPRHAGGAGPARACPYLAASGALS